MMARRHRKASIIDDETGVREASPTRIQ